MENSQRNLIATLVTKAVMETIKDAGSEGAPCTAIYLALQSKGVTFNAYEKIIAGLLNLGVVKKSNDVLYWIGK